MFFYQIAPVGVRSPLLTYASPKPLRQGLLVSIELRSKIAQGVVIAPSEKPDFSCKEIMEILGELGDLQRFLARFIAYYYRASLQASYKLFSAFRSDEHALLRPPRVQQNLAAQNLPPHSRFCDRFYATPQRYLLTLEQKQHITSKLQRLSAPQQQAYDFIESRRTQGKGVSLLFGDTGSGKTEIYFHIIARALLQGRSALFLMPEISLTPQILARLQEVFGDCVALWHSKISKAKKRQILHDLHTQRVKIIAGARSALFLPLANIGAIIVDEEHDDAYKSMSTPRYNARDMAILLSKHARIQVVLGSATPSLTSYKLALDGGYLFRLRGGFYRAKKHYCLESSPTELSQQALSQIAQVLEQGKQAIVFVPTRANFKALLCLECGYGFVCPFCSVNMSVHVGDNALRCHYCGYAQALATSCPECASQNLSSKRIGTAQIARELESVFPNARIGIFDKDHTSTQKKLTSLLGDFKHGRIDVLVGTQMLSKGHDYHNVALVCVLGIDHVLQGGDFRSLERGVALLHQISGRTGRKEHGRVFIQSLQSGWIAEFLEDYEEFLRWELAHRSRVYPPHTRLAMIHCDHANRAKAKAHMNAMLEVLKGLESKFVDSARAGLGAGEIAGASRSLGDMGDEIARDSRLLTGGESRASGMGEWRSAGESGFSILGFGANAIERIANKWRFHILLWARKHADLVYALESLERAGVGEVDVDVDCIETL